ncbi:MAG TPA: phosphotransferase [Chloroflexota bacterium]
MPSHVRGLAEDVIGSPIRRAMRVWGGYAPSATFRLFLGDGRRAVFKGINASSNEYMREALAQEELTYRELAGVLSRWAPTFYGALRFGAWHALLIEDLGPAQVPPWTEKHARDMLRDYAAFHASTLGRTDLPAWLPRDRHRTFAQTWRTLVADRVGLGGAAGLAGERTADARRWLEQHVDHLDATARTLADVPAPHALLHFDTRSDNLRILPGGRLRLFDWPLACLGPHEFDVVACVQTIEAEGGPEPERCLALYADVLPLRPAVVTASIAAIAGFFADRAWRPAIPGLPRVRSIQRRQLRASLAWCARQLELAEPSWLAAVPD